MPGLGIDLSGAWYPAVAVNIERERLRRALKSRLFDEPSRPITVDKYILLAPVGEGTMGTVYRAYDPELDRKVALKLLRLRDDSEAARVRTVREARALARLNHPNVLAIHDAGSTDGEIYLVLEFVEGRDLATWEGSTAALLEMMRAVGRGLAAAHEEGIVHRDLKPANILVGADGRPRVADFGLARGVEASADRPAQTHPTGDASATRTGAAVGTPAYMAPEQFDGEASPRADQFSFCATFYEAFAGRRPFAGDTATELLEAIKRGAIEPPAKSGGLPRWLRPVLARGLAARPADRYESVTALLRDMDAKERRGKIGWVLGGLVVAGVAGLGIERAQRETPEPCVANQDLVAAAWGPERRAAVEQAVAQSDAAAAAGTWQRLERGLDRITARLVEQDLAACEARANGDPDAAAATKCVERAADTLEYATASLLELAPGEGRRLLDAFWAVSDAVDCSETRLPENDTAALDAAWAESGELHRAGFVFSLGRYDDALHRYRQSAERTRNGAMPRLHALALRGIAQTQYWRGEEAESEAVAREALVAAEGSRDPRLIAQAWLDLAKGLSATTEFRTFYIERAREVAEHGGVIDSVGAEIEALEANALYIVNRHREAIPHYERALELLEAEGASPVELARTRSDLAESLTYAGDIDRAIALARQSVEMVEDALGPTNLGLTLARARLAQALMVASRGAEAVEVATAALAPLDANPGAAHRFRAWLLTIRSSALGCQREHDAAIADSEASIAILRAGSEAARPALISHEDGLASRLNGAGRYAEALKVADRVLAEFADLTDEKIALASVQVTRAVALAELGRGPEAIVALEAVRPLLEEEMGDSAMFFNTRATAASIHRLSGQLSVARTLATEALDRAREHNKGPEATHGLLLELARIDHAEGNDAAARSNANKALEVVRTGSIQCGAAKDIETFLAELD